MSDDTVRSRLEALLTPLVPSGWRIIPGLRNFDNLDRVTVVFKQSGFTPLPEAPRGALLNDVLVTIIDPHLDSTTAEDALDDAVLELVTALDSLSGIRWTEAKKVQVSERYQGYDLPLQILSSKKAA